MTEGEHQESGDRVYWLKTFLRGVKPPVRRKFHVPDLRLDHLHELFATANGWPLETAFVLEGEEEEWADPSRDAEWDGSDARESRLGELWRAGETHLTYTYDPDGNPAVWIVQVEACRAPEPERSYPHCLSGRRALPTPPEEGESDLPVLDFERDDVQERLAAWWASVRLVNGEGPERMGEQEPCQDTWERGKRP